MNFAEFIRANFQEWRLVPHHLRTLMIDGERTRRVVLDRITEILRAPEIPHAVGFFVYGLSPHFGEPVANLQAPDLLSYGKFERMTPNGELTLSFQIESPLINASFFALFDPTYIRLETMKMGHRELGRGSLPFAVVKEVSPGYHCHARFTLVDQI